jgi:hypothetical protein
LGGAVQYIPTFGVESLGEVELTLKEMLCREEKEVDHLPTFS